MNINEHTTPEKLERYAFLWSLARMVIAALSLFFGAMPIAYKLMGSSSSLYSLLPLFWIVSGIASAYLLYLWFTSGKSVFGTKDQKTTVLFLIMIVTGLNLGFAGISTNIGVGLVYGMPIAALLFKATAILYLVVAYMLFKQWKANGERLFDTHQSSQPKEPEMSTE